MPTRAQRIAAIDAQIAGLQEAKAKFEARPDEPPFVEGKLPPVVLWRFTEGGQVYSASAIRAGDLWFVVTTDPSYDPPPMAWDELLDWAETVQLSDVAFPSW